MTTYNESITDSTVNYENNLSSTFMNFSSDPTENHKKYLKDKGINPTAFLGIKYGSYKDKPSTIIPYQNIKGNIVCLQHILQDGNKIFHKGSTSSGTFFPIKPIDEAEAIFLTEGYATAYSLQEIADKLEMPASVVSCGSISNIPVVAKDILDKYKEISIIIAPDRPKSFSKNDPVNKSIERCRSLGINKFIFPMESKNGDDWNDIIKEYSIAEILNDIESQLDKPFQKIEFIDDDVQESVSLEQESYPFECLPFNAVDYAKELAVKNMVADSIVGGSILALCSLVVQGNTRIKSSHSTHPLSLFVLSVAESGEGKTTIENFLKKPIESKEKIDYLKYKEDIQIFQHSLNVWQHETKKLNKDEFIEYIKKNPRPNMPADPKIIMSDATTQGILRQFNTGKDSLGLFTAEGVKIFGGYSMQKDNEMHTIGVLSCLWDGEPIEKTRGDEKENLKLFDKSLTSNILIQNHPFSESVWGKPIFHTQGILARFLISRPMPLAGTRIRGLDAITLEHASSFNSRVYNLLNKQERDELKEISLSNDAHRLNIQYYNSIEKESGTGGKYQDIRAFASKTAEQARRIAGVIALFEDYSTNEIDSSVMERAIKLSQWYLDECLRISNEDLKDEDESNQNKILKILEKKGSLTVRDICRVFPDKKLRKSKSINPLIDSLKNQNKIVQDELKRWMILK